MADWITAHLVTSANDRRTRKRKKLLAWSAHREKTPVIEIALPDNSSGNIQSVYLNIRSLIKNLKTNELIEGKACL